MSVYRDITSQELLVTPTGINAIKIGFREPMATQAQLEALSVNGIPGPQGRNGPTGPRGPQGYQGLADNYGDIDGGDSDTIYGGIDPINGGNA